MNWTWAALMPHPPVLVPQVGKGRERDAGNTLKGIEQLVARLTPLNKDGVPDLLVILSPHLPYVSGGAYLNTATRMRGSLSRFGAPDARVELKASPETLAALRHHLRASGIGIAVGELDDITPDHGSVVPLFFLRDSFPGGKLPPAAMINPIGLGPSGALRLGQALASLPGEGRAALLASGDLSHRLLPGAPAGYNPEAADFDRLVVETLRRGDPQPLLRMPGELRDKAGECGLCSVMTLLGLSGGAGIEVFSYEGPYGVGYCTALWNPGAAGTEAARAGSASSRIKVKVGPVTMVKKGTEKPGAAGGVPPSVEPAHSHPYPRLARLAVERYLVGKDLHPDAATLAGLARDMDPAAPPPDWKTEKACFVSIKTKDGALRGCIGTILPTQPALLAEILANAVAAAVRDPRFPPVSGDEMAGLRFSVDVLSRPEPVRDVAELDPAVWGVIVSKGGRRGLLLPALEGVDTVEKQLAIAAQKGGIQTIEGARIERFFVSRYLED